MPEIIEQKQVFSLYEVNKSIEKTISMRYTSSFWVKAEMNKVNYYKHSGHCYPELLEKKDGKLIAKMNAILWKTDYQRINNAFLKNIKEELKDGIKILFLAEISFNPIYGLSLRILDIDPAYTLGDLEKEKQETINKLKEEGIFEQNKKIPFPLLPQRIAVISVESSKGYADFLQVINNNSWNYAFFHYLFPSLLQGDKAVDDIIKALKKIKKIKQHFDLVTIIRGGGGDVGLSCYNNYRLAKEIANFPLPVISGIGHATNTTVVEMISYENAITPTKLAEFLIQKFHNFSVPVKNAQDTLKKYAKNLLHNEKTKFFNEIKYFQSFTKKILENNRFFLQDNSKKIIRYSRYFFNKENDALQQLGNAMRKQSRFYLSEDQKTLIYTLQKMKYSYQQHITSANDKQTLVLKSLKTAGKGRIDAINNQLIYTEKNIKNLSPESILKRGFSISRYQGKVISNKKSIPRGEEMETEFHKGKLKSIIK
jgi:exodeoxyribonuclease VII large subunit